jgi:serine protease Do
MLDRRALLLALAAAPLAWPSRAQGGPIVAPIRLKDERVLIEARIDGQGPYAFAIDTGAVVSGVEEEIARQLRLPVIRKVNLLGRQFDLFKVSDLTLGGAVRQADAALFGLNGNLRGASGLVAAGMVTTFDSTLDFEQLEWRVYPGGLSERPGYERLDSWVRVDAGANGSKRIGVKATLDGKPLKLLVDTGMPRTVVLERDVGRRMGYWDDARPFAPVASSGIAGVAPRPSRALRGRLLEVGGMRFDTPVVTVRDGPPPQQDYDGTIGLPVLERMNLSVDSKAGALWVKANGRPGWRERISRTGLWIDAAPGGAKVSVVGTGSPADAAGLKVGDRIKGESFAAILRSLGADQAPITLTVEGRGAVTFTPADYL